MDKLNLYPRLSKLLYLGTITAAITLAAWGGPKLKLWNFFTNRPASSSTICGTNTQDNESYQDSTSTSLVKSASTNRLEKNADTEGELKTLTRGDSYRKYEMRKREALIRELESRISISTSKTEVLESDWNYLRGQGFAVEFISKEPTFESFLREEAIRNVHRAQIRVLQNEINEYLTNPREPSKEEKQKQKNEILLLRILRRQGRILELNLLIEKSHAVTAKREKEWESILTATARRVRGLRKQILMDQPAFKQLEADKVQVLAGEHASRITYWTEVWLLRDKIQKDKSNIINIPEPQEGGETALPRKEMALAIQILFFFFVRFGSIQTRI